MGCHLKIADKPSQLNQHIATGSTRLISAVILERIYALPAQQCPQLPLLP
jgi:hypothetical protein